MQMSIKAPTPAATGEGARANVIGDDTTSIHTSPPVVNQIEPLLKAADIARVLQVSRTEAYRLMNSEIPTVRFGKQTVRVKASDLAEFIESRTVNHG